MGFAREASDIKLSIVATLPNEHKIIAEGSRHQLHISIRGKTSEMGCLKLERMSVDGKNYWKTIIFKGSGLMLLWDIALELSNKMGDVGVIVEFIPYDRNAYYMEYNNVVYYLDRGEIFYKKENDEGKNFIYCYKSNKNIMERLIQLKLLLVHIKD